MRKAFSSIGVTVQIEEDADIIEFVDSLPRGQVSPWIKKAIRERMEREKGRVMKNDE